ncbi:glycosyltransferase family 4 protein, partial [Bacteriovoracaceae bacterium]|nr:glycosyltransferase family 4 protein [Bacteriovoracaceae bacterium]
DHQPELREQLRIRNDEFVALYIGAHGISHALESVIQTAKVLQKEVTFLFVGEGAAKKKIVELTNQLELKNVIFRSGVPREEIAKYYALSNVCLVPLKDIPGFSTFIPSKMFEIMAMGRPIIASLRGEAKSILDDSKCAIVTSPENTAELKEALIKLKGSSDLQKSLARNARDFVCKNYDRKVLAKKYSDYLEEIIKK